MSRDDIIKNDAESNPKGIILDFDQLQHISFKGKNISDCTLTGKATKYHLFNRINIIHSICKDLYAKQVDFYNGDIKDCAFIKSSFEDCKFDDSAHINNDINETQFYRCSFNQCSITDSEYKDTTFVECNFTNVIISTCRFSRCKFIRCITSNKMIESSLIFDCTFEETNIQAETIIENFGIYATCLVRSKIRSENKKDLVFPSEFSSEIFSSELSVVENFLISYFHNPEILIEGSDNIDSTFDYMNWLKLSKNPNRFRLLIERYHEFILYNYDKDKAPFWMLLKLHKMTNELSNNIDPSKVEIYRSIMGVHMSLSRLVEVYLQLFEIMFLKYSEEKEINFLVIEGPIDTNYYYSKLSDIFEGRSLKIKNVVKHNSPNELLIIWENHKDLIPLLAAFLATRVKFGIQRLTLSDNTPSKITISPSTQVIEYKKNEVVKPVDIIKTEFGFDKYANNYMLKIRAILPGDLLMHLNIEFQTQVFGKMKKILIDILPKAVENQK